MPTIFFFFFAFCVLFKKESAKVLKIKLQTADTFSFNSAIVFVESKRTNNNKKIKSRLMDGTEIQGKYYIPFFMNFLFFFLAFPSLHSSLSAYYSVN